MALRPISAMAPASSTPVGPPPTITNVNGAVSSDVAAWRSASSKASSMRARKATASASVLSPGADPPSRDGRNRRVGHRPQRSGHRRESAAVRRVYPFGRTINPCTSPSRHERSAATGKWSAAARRYRPATEPPWPPDRATAGRDGWFVRSIRVMSTSASRSACAAANPPNPPPIMTTREVHRLPLQTLSRTTRRITLGMFPALVVPDANRPAPGL